MNSKPYEVQLQTPLNSLCVHAVHGSRICVWFVSSSSSSYNNDKTKTRQHCSENNGCDGVGHERMHSKRECENEREPLKRTHKYVCIYVCRSEASSVEMNIKFVS